MADRFFHPATTKRFGNGPFQMELSDLRFLQFAQTPAINHVDGPFLLVERFGTPEGERCQEPFSERVRQLSYRAMAWDHHGAKEHRAGRAVWRSMLERSVDRQPRPAIAAPPSRQLKKAESDS
jgi:hypothetical protein